MQRSCQDHWEGEVNKIVAIMILIQDQGLGVDCPLKYSQVQENLLKEIKILSLLVQDLEVEGVVAMGLSEAGGLLLHKELLI